KLHTQVPPALHAWPLAGVRYFIGEFLTQETRQQKLKRTSAERDGFCVLSAERKERLLDSGCRRGGQQVDCEP
ncbi:MAG TPA: hypothetical protein VEG60_28480, partial [Candidatus Binatia bacterium]|nr:hypothetical protein [Candidatus Binatia bacterium]